MPVSGFSVHEITYRTNVVPAFVINGVGADIAFGAAAAIDCSAAYMKNLTVVAAYVELWTDIVRNTMIGDNQMVAGQTLQISPDNGTNYYDCMNLANKYECNSGQFCIGDITSQTDVSDYVRSCIAAASTILFKIPNAQCTGASLMFYDTHIKLHLYCF